MNKAISCLILFSLLFNTAYSIGLQVNSLLELHIAKDGPTRINIEGEKINDIFIHVKEAAEVLLHESGCVFVLPQQGKDKIYLSIIGENGTTQDLVLHFTKDKPSPIKLTKFKVNQPIKEKSHACIKKESKN